MVTSRLEIERVTARLTDTTDLVDMSREAYDNTRLVAINTCPTWGILRYGMHKSMSGPGHRNMPLEMGSAAHDVFAAVRLYQLRQYQHHIDLADYHGPRLFGRERYEIMLEAFEAAKNEDERSQALAFCLKCLETTGYYDDPSDRRRTYTNLEEGCIAYCDRWQWDRMPVWIRDENDPQSDVGIELPFDVMLSFALTDNTTRDYRFIGKADGLHTRDGILYLHENKTASRLDEAWRQSFALSSQITGYCFALGLWAGQAIENAEIFGMSIPLPKNYDFGGIVRETVSRHRHHFEHWFNWFLHTTELERSYRDDPINAPRYTHSCNRYFRPCSMIPFCDSDEEEQHEILEQMFYMPWSPLVDERAGGD